MTPDPRRRFSARVVLRPHRVVPDTAAEQNALWQRRRAVFGRLVIALLFLAVAMFATGSPRIGAFIAVASLLSLAVVLKARRYIDRTRM
jgi:hypothetical protein